jgi:hypothetical protein
MTNRELEKLINDENGINFHRNIDLDRSWVIKFEDSFIAYKLTRVNGKSIAQIVYSYFVSKKDTIKLLAWCGQHWNTENVQYVYGLEHQRKANAMKKYLKALGFKCISENRPDVWDYKYISTNGYHEDDINEYFL